MFSQKGTEFLQNFNSLGETFFQFWHAVNGLAAMCDFEEIVTTLVLDMFTLDMSNTKTGTTKVGAISKAQKAQSWGPFGDIKNL